MLPERFKSTPGFTIEFLLLLLCSEFQWNSAQNTVRFGRHPTVPSQAHYERQLSAATQDDFTAVGELCTTGVQHRLRFS